MKKIETIAKELETVTAEELQAIIGTNENVDVETLTTSEKFCVLVYRELAKELRAKNRALVLDCNYPKSNFAHKTEAQLAKGQTPQWLVNYYRVVDDAGKSLIQVYTKNINTTNGEIAFDVCTSCASGNREQFDALEDELHFTVQRRKDGTPRTSTKRGISYEGLKEIVKVACAILYSTSDAKAAAKKAKEEEAKARAEAKAEAMEEEAKLKASTKPARAKRAKAVKKEEPVDADPVLETA